MKKLLLSLFVLLGSAAYVLAERGWLAARDADETQSAEASETPAMPTSPATPSASSAPPALPTGEPTRPTLPTGEPAMPPPTAPTLPPTTGRSADPDAALAALATQVETLKAAATASGPYHDGEYTGPQADAYYGYVEVFIDVEKGQIVTVRAAHFPRSSPTSLFLNRKAVPKLNKQVIRTQSGAVDVITGATLTSRAYAVSLAGALQQARS